MTKSKMLRTQETGTITPETRPTHSLALREHSDGPGDESGGRCCSASWDKVLYRSAEWVEWMGGGQVQMFKRF